MFERFVNGLIISELIDYSKKYNVPFHVFIYSELIHERVYGFKGKKDEINGVLANIMYDTPRPYQFEQVKKNLRPVKGVVEKYARDPALDCYDLKIRTEDLEQNLNNFIEIKKRESQLLEDMIEVLSTRRYVKKFEDNGISYTIHKISAILPPKELSLLVKQYDLYTQGMSVSEATHIVKSEWKNLDDEIFMENR